MIQTFEQRSLCQMPRLEINLGLIVGFLALDDGALIGPEAYRCEILRILRVLEIDIVEILVSTDTC